VLTACRAGSILLLLLSIAAGKASAQGLPEGPINAFGGRMTVSGEVLAIASSEDNVAFLN
jgi:hypothetical protein